MRVSVMVASAAVGLSACGGDPIEPRLDDVGTWRGECAFDYSCVSMDAPDGSGAALRFEVRQSDNDGTRRTRGAEIRSPHYSKAAEFADHRAARHSFEAFIPSDAATEPDKPVVIAQIHGFPNQDEGEPWRDPIGAFMLYQGRLLFRAVSDDRRVTEHAREERDWVAHPTSVSGGRFDYTKGVIEIDLGEAKYDQWVSIGAAVTFSFEDQGRLILRFDGDEQRRDGVNIGFNDSGGPYFKVGVYPFAGSEREKTAAYFRNVRVGLGPGDS